ncbi:NAD(P)-binding protein [Peniophora sp. CONT]|nr:NAD(P)-binding protein [Peniophora sp. CONT]
MGVKATNKKAEYDPARDIPRLDGKVVIITGGYSGIGLEACRQLLMHGATVYMLIRTPARAESVIKQLETDIPEITGKKRVHYIQVDFSNMSEVRKAGEEFMKREQRLDVLVHNAGRMVDKNMPYTLTDEGVEIQYAINHLAVAVLTRTLAPVLKATPGDVRVVVTSSSAHQFSPSSPDFSSIAGWNATRGNSLNKKSQRYAITKCMNILWTAHQQLCFSKTPGLESIMVLAVHPGWVLTDGMINGAQAWLAWLTRAFAMTPEQGAYTTLFAATAPEVREEREKYGGKYLVPFGKVQRPKKGARGEKKARILWEATEKIMDDLLGKGGEPEVVAEQKEQNAMADVERRDSEA